MILALRGLLLILALLTMAASFRQLPQLPEAVAGTVQQMETFAADFEASPPPGVGFAAWTSVLIGTLLQLGMAAVVAALALAAGRRPVMAYLGLGLAGLTFSEDSLVVLGIPLPPGMLSVRLPLLLGAAGLAYFCARFPRDLTKAELAVAHSRTAGRGRLRRWRAGVFRRIGGIALRPRLHWGVWVVVSGGVTVFSLTAAGDTALALLWAYLIPALAASLHLLAVQVSTGDSEDSERALSLFASLHVVLWTILLLMGGAFPLVVFATLRWGVYMGPWAFDVVGQAGLLAALVLLGWAVFVRGAVDARLVIRRTAVVGLFGIVAIFLAGLVEAAVSELVLARLELPSEAGVLIAGGAIAVAFGPIHQGCRTLVDRLYRSRLPVDYLESGHRDSAAIVFTDLVGYTALSAEHPDEALRALSVLHRAGYAVARRNGGRVVKTIGDEVMAAYPDPASGARAARTLHETFMTSWEVVDGGARRLRLRSGVDCGPVAESVDGDLYGQTVNVAARLQGQAEPGGIVMSAAVVEGVGDEFDVRSLGALVLKNVPEPVDAFLLADPVSEG